MTDAYDDGFDLFKREPELLLVEVWHRANALAHYTIPQQHAFVNGYRHARKQYDEYNAQNPNRLG